jgi:HAD superfamily hydrolase (TIGR01490 family)
VTGSLLTDSCARCRAHVDRTPTNMSNTCAASKVAAFFDFDNTLLPGQPSELRFFRFLWRRGLVGWREVYESLSWLLRHGAYASLQPLRERKLYLRDKRANDIESLADEFSRDVLCPGLSPDGLARMDEHRRAGHHVVVVTGSLDFLIVPLARWLGIDRVLAATPERLDGRYTGDLVAPLPYGEGKRLLITELALHNGLDLAACYAYGDSPGDVEILRLVGHPLVINPIRGMREIARRHHWPVVRWE